MSIDNDTLDEWTERVRDADRLIDGIANRTERLTMRIPADPKRDADIIISDLARATEALVTEVRRLRTWDGLMSLLDEHYPADIFGGPGDVNAHGDTGPRIVALTRALDEAKRERNRAEHWRDDWRAGVEFWQARAEKAERERNDLAWAETLTHQECDSKKHPDWFIDSEHSIACPWCRAEKAEAELAKVNDAYGGETTLEWMDRALKAERELDEARGDVARGVKAITSAVEVNADLRGERDEARAILDRVRALADEWDGEGIYGDNPDAMVGLLDHEARHVVTCLRAALDGEADR